MLYGARRTGGMIPEKGLVVARRIETRVEVSLILVHCKNLLLLARGITPDAVLGFFGGRELSSIYTDVSTVHSLACLA